MARSGGECGFMRACCGWAARGRGVPGWARGGGLCRGRPRRGGVCRSALGVVARVRSVRLEGRLPRLSQQCVPARRFREMSPGERGVVFAQVCRGELSVGRTCSVVEEGGRRGAQE